MFVLLVNEGRYDLNTLFDDYSAKQIFIKPIVCLGLILLQVGGIFNNLILIIILNLFLVVWDNFFIFFLLPLDLPNLLLLWFCFRYNLRQISIYLLIGLLLYNLRFGPRQNVLVLAF